MTRNKFLLLLSMIACFGMIVSAGFAATKPVAAKWGFVRKVTIDNQNAQLTDAVIKVQLDNGFDYAKAAIGGADIRFAAKADSFSGAGLSYWIEQWNDNGASTLWVKVPKLTKGQNSIYLYYGNVDAKAAADGNATFLFFDDFESGDFTKKWNNVSIGQVEEKEGILKLKESDGQVGMITTGFDLTGKLIVRTLYHRQGGDQHWTAAGIGGWNNWFCFDDHTEVAGMG
ncbi:MAG: DUF2341 domain-containing protein, partial [Mucilaginibacter sp.]|nr:DUF2341 domain-containing protein [Mucilaginibacter sp.]